MNIYYFRKNLLIESFISFTLLKSVKLSKNTIHKHILYNRLEAPDVDSSNRIRFFYITIRV